MSSACCAMRRCSARHAPAQRRSRPRARAPRASVCGWGCAHLAGAPAALAVAGAPAAAASDRAPRRATQRCGAGGAGGGSSSGDGETRTKDPREQLAELKEQRASQAEPRAPLKRSSYRAPKAHSRTQRSRADDDTSDSRRSRGAEPSAGRVEVLVDGYNVCMVRIRRHSTWLPALFVTLTSHYLCSRGRGSSARWPRVSCAKHGRSC